MNIKPYSLRYNKDKPDVDLLEGGELDDDSNVTISKSRNKIIDHDRASAQLIEETEDVKIGVVIYNQQDEFGSGVEKKTSKVTEKIR
jgi:hypothetical protein